MVVYNKYVLGYVLINEEAGMKSVARKLTVTGNSGTYYVTLPKDLVRELGWRKGQKVVVEKKGETLVVRDWVKDAK